VVQVPQLHFLHHVLSDDDSGSLIFLIDAQNICNEFMHAVYIVAKGFDPTDQTLCLFMFELTKAMQEEAFRIIREDLDHRLTNFRKDLVAVGISLSLSQGRYSQLINPRNSSIPNFLNEL